MRTKDEAREAPLFTATLPADALWLEPQEELFEKVKGPFSPVRCINLRGTVDIKIYSSENASTFKSTCGSPKMHKGGFTFNTIKPAYSSFCIHGSDL